MNIRIEVSPEDVLNNAAKYPVLRYMGSKYKLLPWIYEQLKEVPFKTALDGFSGSGAVSYLLKLMNKRVYSNDFLHFSHILTKGTVENSFQKLTPGDMALLLEETEEAPRFIEETYKGIFYTPGELRFLDKLSFNIRKLSNQYKKALAMASMVRSCVKKQPRGVFTISGNMDKYNDGRRDLKLSLDEHFSEQVEVYNKIVFSNGLKHKSFTMDIFNFNTEKYKPDLVYLDPPYVPRSDDNCYIKRYHFLEGLSKYWKDEEILYSTKVKKIKKRYTPFSYRRSAIQGFTDLFKKFASSIIVLSYSSNGYPDLDTLVELLKSVKKNVKVSVKDHKYHFGTHKSVKRSIVQEYLIIGI